MAKSDSFQKYKKLSVIGFIVIAVIYLAIIIGFGRLFARGLDVDYASPTSLEILWKAFTLPIGISLVFVYIVIAYLGWWKPVFKDDKPVRKWVKYIPITMVIAILLGINYSGLADKGIGFTLLLLLTTMFVGFAEEGMFRGIGVTTFRLRGFTEGKVALYTSLLFGLAHAVNLFSEGPSALLQVMVVAVAGYYFYLLRRYFGGLIGPALFHGFWDFALISGVVVADETYAGSFAPLLADVVILIIILTHLRKVEPSKDKVVMQASSDI